MGGFSSPEANLTGTSFYNLEKIPDGRSGGTTQAETRVYNERLVVALVRRHGQLSKSDLARLTSLAPQTITSTDATGPQKVQSGLWTRLRAQFTK